MRIRYRHLILSLLITTLLAGCAKKHYFAKTPVADPAVYQQLQNAPEKFDSVTVIAGKHYDRSAFHNLFWGKHYRQVWDAPVKVPILDLDTVAGGLRFVKLGGGFQTTSMTLEDSTGGQYALRSLDKDPYAVLPKALRHTFVLDLLRDQTSAINPYGALVAARLAEAANIPHSSPRLVYVAPHDSAFGKNTDRFSDRLFILENKYDSEKDLTSRLKKAEDIEGSKKVLRERFSNNHHHFDEQAFAKARLLDLLIGDWDRHEGQWEWAEYNRGEETMYRPIPKDRDNTFFKMDDGLFSWLLTRKWAVRKFETFHKNYRDVQALMINSSFIDPRALNQVTRQQFDSLAHQLQQSLTDEAIEAAVHRLPPKAFELTGPEIIAKLKSRRDQLPQAAARMYAILAKQPMVIGTDEEERFEVKRLNDDETEVTVYRSNPDNEVIYHRIFYRSETDEISLYGLGEDDVFEVSGKVDKGIKVKIVGGRGEDKITDTSDVDDGGKKTWVYDTKRGTDLEAGPTTKDKRSKDVSVNAFDREGYSR